MDENEYKLCPVCGSKPEVTKCSTALTCSNYDCPLWSGFYDVEDWQNQPRVDALTAEVTALRARVAELEAEKDGAYSERDKLVSVLSKVYPASLERHQPENDNWENDWRWVVFVDTPTGQVSWHIHDSELPMFSHLRRNAGRVWDGHTTDEKYNRLARITPPEAE